MSFVWLHPAFVHDCGSDPPRSIQYRILFNFLTQTLNRYIQDMNTNQSLRDIAPDERDQLKRYTGLIAVQQHRTNQASDEWLINSVKPIVEEEEVQEFLPTDPEQGSAAETPLIPWNLTAIGSEELAKLSGSTKFDKVRDNEATFIPTGVVSVGGRKLQEVRISGPDKSRQASFFWTQEGDNSTEGAWGRDCYKKVDSVFHGDKEARAPGLLWLSSKIFNQSPSKVFKSSRSKVSESSRSKVFDPSHGTVLFFDKEVRQDIGLIDVRIPASSNPDDWENLQLRSIAECGTNEDGLSKLCIYLASGFKKYLSTE